MNSKSKGDVAELKVMQYLIEHDYTVLKPFGDNSRYDIVSEKNGEFERIQVKYRTMDNGGIGIQRFSTTRNNKKVRYTQTEIDCIIVYCPDNDSIYKLNICVFDNKSEIFLRIKDAKNKQKKNIINAIDYIL